MWGDYDDEDELALHGRLEANGGMDMNRWTTVANLGNRFMAASKVLGEETVAGSAGQQEQENRGRSS